METLKGKILHTSWGYDMTINDYCVVIDETPKSILCKMVSAKITDDNGLGNGKAMPTLTELDEKPFRLFKRGQDDFRGSYPYCSGSKKKGYFSIWNGRPNYHNTWD